MKSFVNEQNQEDAVDRENKVVATSSRVNIAPASTTATSGKQTKYKEASPQSHLDIRVYCMVSEVKSLDCTFSQHVDGKLLQHTLRAIRSTPVGGPPSPSVLLQSRNLRGSLPFVAKALKQQNVSSWSITQVLKQRQATAVFHQSTARPCHQSILALHQRVRARVGKKWISGRVQRVCQQPDSYVVATDDGRVSSKSQGN
ncbi:hypothetical protein OUZ56_024231 [Daphnia magna]|uniref:Uncharacterized protein n=1 Tax=Daphnia magna TaxID=35525 RepID=A0ABR0B0D7_9CRUS|nr:hypothetical protein OUZ56_024231 [Daphnia magna]